MRWIVALSVLVFSLSLAAPSYAQGGGKRQGDRRKEGGPKAGEQAKDIKLRLLGGKDDELVQLSKAWADGPVVLIFGSYT
ncbi:MAG: hypothetical protein AAB434_01515 [Planctomycetota bacterium]